MSRRLTSHRCWPAAPAGARDSIHAIAVEIAGGVAKSVAPICTALEAEAVALLRRLARQGGAPTRAVAVERLRRLQAAAAALAQACADLDPVTLSLLAARSATLPLRAAVVMARRIADSANVARLDLVNATPPTPGPGNLADRLWGDPRLSLCRGCCGIVSAFAGKDACSSSPGGLVHRTAAAVWDRATGEVGEEAGLERYVAMALSMTRAADAGGCSAEARFVESPGRAGEYDKAFREESMQFSPTPQPAVAP
ncbi:MULTISPECIES: hypothetical protein [Roseomonadaceae]|uniref:Uncharacterized protein n=1 Tax=Falsiroseomonas oleicola TaxID=2801474 RepID=A0ABS6H6L0_9PROT|nr:hypothetical protein [Roseomonas oleicola]MBU8544327.1 hypothetical protein [Roseomonas oleicola]